MLVVRNLGVQFGQQWLWRNLSFEVAEGMQFCIIGPSGTGKSVLLRTLAGLRPATEGSISFQGTSLQELPLPKYRSRVVYLPQTPPMIEGSVRENIQVVLSFAENRACQYDEDRICSELDHLGRPASFLDKAADSLSGGERQIVAFLRAQQLNPAIVLLDEPVASLDEKTGLEVKRMVAHAIAEGSLDAAVWTAHQRDELGGTCDSILDLIEQIGTDDA